MFEGANTERIAMKKATQMDYIEEMGVFNDCWALLKKYYFIDSDPAEWAAMTAEASTICQKYHFSEFANRLVHLVIDRLEYLHKERLDSTGINKR